MTENFFRYIKRNIMTEKVPILGHIMKIIACTPNKNFDEVDYQQKVIEPTRQLRKLYEELGDKEPNTEQIVWAYTTLENILIAKKVENEERIERTTEFIKEYELSKILNTTAS